MTLSGHSEGISSAVWMEETSICTASWDHSIRIWDLQQASSISTIVSFVFILHNEVFTSYLPIKYGYLVLSNPQNWI